MSAAEKIAKLEALLERIERIRAEAPVHYDDAVAAAESAADEPGVMETILEEDAPIPEPAVPASAVVGAPRPSSRPTPMEQAISTELDLGPADEDEDEPELEISYPDEDEPVLVLEAEEPTESAPTAPLRTRSPEPEPEPEPEPVTERPPPPTVEETLVAEPELEVAPAAEPFELAVPKASAPVAKVVSQPKARTFGELIERALALRPR